LGAESFSRIAFSRTNFQFERIVTGRVAQPAMVALFPHSTLPETAQPWLVALPFPRSFFQIENCRQIAESGLKPSFFQEMC
jgi:hypothetical protein